MKKNLLLIFIVLSLFTSLANARFFLGIDGGYSMDKVDVKKEDVTAKGVVITPGYSIKNAYAGNGYLFNINLGTEHHFDKDGYVGFRWLLDLGYGRTNLINQYNSLISYPSSIIEGNLGVDLLLDVIKFGNHSLGLFGGVEGGAKVIISDAYYYGEPNYYGKSEKYRAFGLIAPMILARVGVSLFLADHHRIEFITKIPVYRFDFDNSGSSDEPNNGNKFYKPIQFMFGYKFIF